MRTLFTLSDIETAHSKVKSGADFPAYAREIHAMRVTGYDVYVTDGRSISKQEHVRISISKEMQS